MNNPNQRHGAPFPPPPPPVAVVSPPKVWPWYLGYAIGMALLYFGVTAMGIVAARGGSEYQNARTGIFLVLGPLLAIPYAAAPFLPKKPWAWIYHLVLIGVGFTSVCCLPVTIPLLLEWLKPDVKRFFGRI